METKVCSKCKEKKSLDSFSSNVAKPGGKDPMCKNCRNEYNRKYYGQHLDENHARSRKYSNDHKTEIAEKNHEKYLLNKEEILERNKKYFESDAGKISSQRIRKRYYIKNLEKCKKRSKESRVKTRGRHAELQRSYRKTPIGKIHDATHRHRRRSMNKKTECTLTLNQWNKILKMQGNKCANCKREFSNTLPPTKDHIIPLSLGGGLTFGNVQALCASCNSIKHDKIEIANAIDTLLVESC